jgi:hypothetical protein
MREAEETKAEVRAVLRRMVKGRKKQASVQAIGPPWRKSRGSFRSSRGSAKEDSREKEERLGKESQLVNIKQ